MAHDRFIHFKEPINFDQLKTILEGYFSDGPVKLDKLKSGPDHRWWFYSMEGRPSHERDWLNPEARERVLDPKTDTVDRALEVSATNHIDSPDLAPSIDVMTRFQDRFTCDIADSLTQLLARKLGGEIEPP